MTGQRAACAVLALAVAMSGCTATASLNNPGSGSPAPGTFPLSADIKREIDDGYRATANRLSDSTPGSRELVAKARGVLVFPPVFAAGLVVGAQYGEGELRIDNPVAGY